MHCICCLSNDLKHQPLGFDDFVSCPNCGHLFQSGNKPVAIQSSIVEHYRDDDPHARVADSKLPFFKYVMDYLTTAVDQKNRTILDIGCGPGYFLELANKSGWEIYGAELVYTLANQAKQRLATENIFQGKLKEANYPAKFFGAITLWDVLFMVDNPSRELQECLRILRNGGIVGIRVRNVLFQKIAYYAYLPFKAVCRKLGIKYLSVFHPYCFNAKSLDTLLSRLGYTNIQITNSPLTIGDPYSHLSLRGLLKNIKRLINLISMAVFKLSGEKWIIGLSLLIWAEKPEKLDTPR
jgi:SAM-dependent methyltransferase